MKNKKRVGEICLEMIKQLYIIERQATEMTYDLRKELREEQSRPILNEFCSWMTEKNKEVLLKIVIALALREVVKT